METIKLQFNYNDGGRSKYFKAENVGDCVTRAIAIASDTDYKEVYDALKELAKQEKITKRHPKQSSVRWGVYKNTYRKYLFSKGWEFVPLMSIGSGCKHHMAANEIPMNGKIICVLSNHLSCVVDGIINDTYDCSREGSRCVYGYFQKK